MTVGEASRGTVEDLYITGELDRRSSALPDYRQEMLALHDLAARMADSPEELLPRFVDLAMEITGGASAGLSLYEETPAPGVFRWRYLRGALSSFENTTTPRHFSPCGVTLDQNGPVLSRHPERLYDWISDAGIVVPEVLLVPLYIHGAAPLGTLWIIAEREGHFTREHARAMAELGAFVSIALRMREAEHRIQAALNEQELLAREMSHRVKNLFAITDGMIRAGARTAPDVGSFAKTLSGRLHALASAHALVSRNLREVGRTPRTGDIGSLIGAITEPYEERADAPRIRTSGPKVRCSEHALNSLALIFHELATNAAKYGALSRPTGFIDVCWTVSNGNFALIWVERGGPSLQGPVEQNGFGSTLVRSAVTGQLAGTLTHDWDPGGLKITMRIPVSTISG